MKMNWKKFTCMSALCLLLFGTTGCVRTALASHSKIEPCAFTINPPTKNDFVMLIPDSDVKNNIIGKWKYSGACQCYSETDINGRPFLYQNTPGVVSEETMEFRTDGTLHMTVRTKTIHPQTKKEGVNTVEQTGSWRCENGLLRITAKNTKTGEDIVVCAIASWPNRTTMNFRIDIDSFQRIVKETTAKARLPRGGALDGIDCHYDDDGNLYMTTKITVITRGTTCKNRTITKQPPKIFTLQN